jgi:signal peptidase
MEKDKENTEEEDEEEEQDLKGYLLGLARDVIIAVIIMVLIIGTLFWYTGNWPPMVVVESDSMMHDDDSSVGVIDTGDLVLVKEIDSKNDVNTYAKGELSGKKTYDTYGDVIIFRKNGFDDTPVIHRAVLWVEYNKSGNNHMAGYENYGSFDIPSRGKYNIMEYHIKDYYPKHFNLSIDFKVILQNFKEQNVVPHSGFITKGDNNYEIDQISLPDKYGNRVRPIKVEWVVGKAEGELPWFGLIKLYISGNTDDEHTRPPTTSRNMLIISIALIVIIPIVIDVLFSIYSRKKAAKNEESEVVEKSSVGPPPGTNLGGRNPPTSNRMARPRERPPPSQHQAQNQRLGEHGPREFTSKEDLFRKIK